MTMPQTEAGGDAKAVGVPIQEAVLTRTVRAQPHALLDTTAMGALVVLEEVELGVGRPDILLLNLDLHTLALRRAAGLRLANLTEARALGARMSGDMAGVGVSARHARQLLGHLSAIGWLDSLSRVVWDSMLIEAKVKDWGTGVRQLNRVRWAAHSAVLLLHAAAAERVPETILQTAGLGLLAGDDLGGLQWLRLAPRRAVLPFFVDAWLGELALRQLEPAPR